jgi:hypothetical protein
MSFGLAGVNGDFRRCLYQVVSYRSTALRNSCRCSQRRSAPRKTAHRPSPRIHYGQTFESQLARLRAAGCSDRNIASTGSKIESDVTLGLAAADQQIALGRRLDRVRPVGDGAGNQPGLAIMTNSGAARPAHRHITRLGQFEQAVGCGTPVYSEIAARKGYQRPDLRCFRRRIGRWMRGPPRDRGDARRLRRARPEIPNLRFPGAGGHGRPPGLQGHRPDHS